MAKSTQVLQTRIEIEHLLNVGSETVSLGTIKDIVPDLLSFSYVDKETDEADEIAFVLKDPDGKWSRRFAPSISRMFSVFIVSGNIKKAEKKLFCGHFYSDEISVRGAPRTCEIRAISIPLNWDIRRTLKCRAWEKKSLREIASTIVREHREELQEYKRSPEELAKVVSEFMKISIWEAKDLVARVQLTKDGLQERQRQILVALAKDSKLNINDVKPILERIGSIRSQAQKSGNDSHYYMNALNDALDSLARPLGVTREQLWERIAPYYEEVLDDQQKSTISRFLTGKKTITKHDTELVIDIAEKEALLYFSGEKHDRIEQQWESDLAFLSKQCKDNGYSIKIKNMNFYSNPPVVRDQIIIFDQASYEAKKPIKTLTLNESNILSWEFSSLQSDMYKSCTIKLSFAGGEYDEDLSRPKNGYLEYDEDLGAKKKLPTAFTYYDPSLQASGQGQEYLMKKRVKSLKQAQRLAKSKLRELNKKAVTGSIKLVGDVDIIAGVVVECRAFGIFDGKFIVSEATHEVGDDGYTTSIAVRRVNAEY